MKFIIGLSLFLLFTIRIGAQDYLIRFESSDISRILDSVFVINQASGESVALDGSEVLHLKNSSIPTNIPSGYLNGNLALYPNPTEDNTTLGFETSLPGTAYLAIYNVTGTKLAELQKELSPGRHAFQASGFGTGLYLVRVNAGGNSWTGKLVSNSANDPDVRLAYLGSVEDKEAVTTLKTTESSRFMEYKPGEQLLFTFTSGEYATSVSAVPTCDQTIIGYFYDCIDGDNNMYPIVKIGAQFWMGANLKTTRFNNGEVIPGLTGSYDWILNDSAAYSWQRNDMETYKNAYGALYNGYAIENENLCPLDWHVPSASEFITLEQTLGSRAVAGGRLKESGLSHWDYPNTGASNSSGFTMLPGGYRFGGEGSGFSDLGRYGYLWSATVWENEGVANYWGFSKDEEKTEQGVSGLHTGFSVRCIRNDSVPERTVPHLVTDSVSQAGITSATVHYTITSDGGRKIVVTGICWGTAPDPDTTQCKTAPAMGIGHYSISLDSLKPNTLYYTRAFAINIKGIAYGNTIAFRTPENNMGTVTDIEGNLYKTVKIGRQVWMAENLRTETYDDGKPIVLRTNYYVWTRMTSGVYCWYGNNEDFKLPYGALYNWYSAATGKLCPSGWHVPEIEEWQELSGYLGGKAVAGGKLKESGSSHWHNQADGATNSSEFTALPGGWRSGTYDSVLAPFNGDIGMNEKGAWMSATVYQGEYELSVTLDAQSNELKTRQTQLSEGNSVRCLKNDMIIDILPPTVKTAMPAFIPRTWANVTGTIVYNGGSTLSRQGICWSTHPDPDVSDSTKTDTTRLKSFSLDIPVFEPQTTYYIRAFAINSGGIGYGNTLILKTLPAVEYGSVSDVDGNSYKTVQIGTQTWMAENLKTTTLNDGIPIPPLTENDNLGIVEPAYCWYENNISYKTPYGALYNWQTVATGKVCPTGWHVPSQHQWEILRDFLGGEEEAGKKLKEAGTTHWQAAGGSDSTGFNALPGGIRGYNYPKYDFYGFCLMHQFGTWMTSNSKEQGFIQRVTLEAGNNSLKIDDGNDGASEIESVDEGASIRCIKNNPPAVP